MDSLLRDLRFAVRGLLRTPGFTCAAVLALALGIGATTAIFSVVHAVLLRSLGWGEEERLVAIHSDFPGHKLTDAGISPPEYLDLLQSSVLESVGVYDTGTATLQGTPVERVRASSASASFFRTLGVAAAFGRIFADAEDTKGNDGVVLIGDAFFHKRFGGDPAVVGRTVVLDGAPHTVVGVLPESFRFGPPQDVYVPFGFNPAEMPKARTRHGLLGVGRIRRGSSLEQARADLAALTRKVRAEHPDLYSEEAGWRFNAKPLRNEFVGPTRDPLLLLLGAVALVLLIACANVAHLLLARSAARGKELAVRAALGAGRLQIVRQLLTESAVLATVGAILGVAVAAWSMDALLASAPPAVRDLAMTRLHWPVFAFAAGLCVATTLLFGLLPALRSSTPDLASAMKEAGAGGAPSTGRSRSALIAGQVALSFVLLTASGLVLRSFAHVLDVPPGFDAEGVVTAAVAPAGPSYDDSDAARARYFSEAVRRVAAIPGVLAAGGANALPLTGSVPRSYRIDGYEPAAGEPQPVSQIRRVEPGYLAALRIPLMSGRDLSALDDARAPLVALVNEAWARRYFPGRDVLGKRLLLAIGSSYEGGYRTVVGVVKDVRELGLDQPAAPTFYLPQAQSVPNQLRIAARVRGDPGHFTSAVREALTAVDPAQPPDEIRPLADIVGGSLAPRRFPLQLLSAFAGLALLLSALGIYGITAYAVEQRTREIGVRMAIGATAGNVVRMMLTGSLRTLGVGLVIGSASALAVAEALSSQLYGVGPRDPLTYLAIALLLTAVALLASGLPALRAARIDPMAALRSE